MVKDSDASETLAAAGNGEEYSLRLTYAPDPFSMLDTEVLLDLFSPTEVALHYSPLTNLEMAELDKTKFSKENGNPTEMPNSLGNDFEQSSWDSLYKQSAGTAFQAKGTSEREVQVQDNLKNASEAYNQSMEGYTRKNVDIVQVQDNPPNAFDYSLMDGSSGKEMQVQEISKAFDQSLIDRKEKETRVEEKSKSAFKATGITEDSNSSRTQGPSGSADNFEEVTSKAAETRDANHNASSKQNLEAAACEQHGHYVERTAPDASVQLVEDSGSDTESQSDLDQNISEPHKGTEQVSNQGVDDRETGKNGVNEKEIEVSRNDGVEKQTTESGLVSSVHDESFQEGSKRCWKRIYANSTNGDGWLCPSATKRSMKRVRQGFLDRWLVKIPKK